MLNCLRITKTFFGKNCHLQGLLINSISMLENYFCSSNFKCLILEKQKFCVHLNCCHAVKLLSDFADLCTLFLFLHDCCKHLLQLDLSQGLTMTILLGIYIQQCIATILGNMIYTVRAKSCNTFFPICHIVNHTKVPHQSAILRFGYPEIEPNIDGIAISVRNWWQKLNPLNYIASISKYLIKFSDPGWNS